MSNTTRILLGLVTALLAYCNCGAEPLDLRHNPFARPPSAVTEPVRGERAPADSSIEPVVIATMIGSRNALANVDGEVLKPGDEIYGYTLVRVFEDRAIFDRQGKRITVYVKPQLDESDE